MAPRARVSQLRIPNVADIDFGRLRAGRLARLQAAMRRHGLPVCLFFNPANIRYATGTDVMGVWTAGTFARYCVVPAEGEPVLFEYKGSVHVSRRLVRDVRPAFTWQYGGAAGADKAREWARSVKAVLAELGARARAARRSTGATPSASSRSRPRASGWPTPARPPWTPAR